jgi:hypothetical protein
MIISLEENSSGKELRDSLAKSREPRAKSKINRKAQIVKWAKFIGFIAFVEFIVFKNNEYTMHYN